MLYQWWRRVRRRVRHWTTDPTRADRNAVIQRVVAAAAKESKDNLSSSSGEFRRTLTSPPEPSPLSAQLLGQEVPPEDAISTEQIGRRAHDIWIRNGRPIGTAAADWRQAEAELRAERRSAAS